MNDLRAWIAQLAETLPPTVWELVGDSIDESLALINQAEAAYRAEDLTKLRIYTHKLHSSLAYLAPTEITQLSWQLQEIVTQELLPIHDIWATYHCKVLSFLVAFQAELPYLLPPTSQR